MALQLCVCSPVMWIGDKQASSHACMHARFTLACVCVLVTQAIQSTLTHAPVVSDHSACTIGRATVELRSCASWQACVMRRWQSCVGADRMQSPSPAVRNDCQSAASRQSLLSIIPDTGCACARMDVDSCLAPFHAQWYKPGDKVRNYLKGCMKWSIGVCVVKA